MILHLLRMCRNVNRNVFNDRKNVSATAEESVISFESNIESNILENPNTNRISNRIRIFSGFKFD